MGSHRRLIAIGVVVLGTLGIAFGPPIARGWHIGFNAATDEGCETRLGLQWCGQTGQRAAEAKLQEEVDAREHLREIELAESARKKAEQEEAAEEAKREQEALELPAKQAEEQKAQKAFEARSHCEDLKSEGKTC